MLETLKNISDLAKFFILLLVYTGGMMWWASDITSTVSNNKNLIETYMAKDIVEMHDHAIAISQVTALQKQMEKLWQMEEDNIKTHVKCATLMDTLLDRLNKVEIQEKGGRK